MTVYEACKSLIEDRQYEYNDMLKKINLFKRGNKLTAEQYDELLGMMDAHKAEDEVSQP